MYRKNVNAILHLNCDKCSFVVGNYMQKKKKSKMVSLLVGSDARVNNIANQTKSSNKIF